MKKLQHLAFVGTSPDTLFSKSFIHSQVPTLIVQEFTQWGSDCDSQGAM